MGICFFATPAAQRRNKAIPGIATATQPPSGRLSTNLPAIRHRRQMAFRMQSKVASERPQRKKKPGGRLPGFRKISQITLDRPQYQH